MDMDILREATKCPTTTGTSDELMATLSGVWRLRVCRVLGFSRARLQARRALVTAPPRLDAALAERTQQLIERHPSFGYRRLTVLQQRYRKVALLIVDELSLVPFERTGGDLLFNLLAQRYERRSTIITTNLPFS
jgi:hypothetical protein